MKNTLEIIKEARKAGMQVAIIMFIAFLVVSCLFGYFIHKTFDTPPSSSVISTMDNENGNNTITQDIN